MGGTGTALQVIGRGEAASHAWMLEQVVVGGETCLRLVVDSHGMAADQRESSCGWESSHLSPTSGPSIQSARIPSGVLLFGSIGSEIKSVIFTYGGHVSNASVIQGSAEVTQGSFYVVEAPANVEDGRLTTRDTAGVEHEVAVTVRDSEFISAGS
jgi:hypothetical protein